MNLTTGLGIVCCCLLACGGSGRISAPETTTPPVVTDHVDQFAVDHDKQTPSVPSEENSTPPPDAQPPAPMISEVVSSDCRGERLNLLEISQAHKCEGKSRESMPIPADMVKAMTPDPMIVESGKFTDAVVQITNPRSTDVSLSIDDSCDGMSDVTSIINDAAGKRIDGTSTSCGQLCAGRTVDILLTPGGTAYIPFTVDARVEQERGLCDMVRRGKIKRGKHRLEVTSPLGTFNAAVIVR
jgi:hypothetical protein